MMDMDIDDEAKEMYGDGDGDDSCLKRKCRKTKKM